MCFEILVDVGVDVFFAEGLAEEAAYIIAHRFVSILRGIAGCDHDDIGGCTFLFDAPREFVPADAGQLDIQKNNVGRFIQIELPSFLGGGCGIKEVILMEDFVKQFSEKGAVLHNENMQGGMIVLFFQHTLPPPPEWLPALLDLRIPE